MPTVSVIIPLYNKGVHIEKTLKSVFNQTEQDFEIIVVDGNSTDEGPEIVKKNKDHRLHLFTQEGKGVSAARNQGIDKSKSNFITFLDADDEWLPNHLDTLLRLRKKYPQAGAYTTAYLVKNKNNEIKIPSYKEIPSPYWEGILPNYFKSVTYGEPPIWTSVVGIEKKIFEEIGKFEVDSWWGEDHDLWARIALKYEIAFSWEISAIYHMEAFNRLGNLQIPVKEHPFLKKGLIAINKGNIPAHLLNDLEEYLSFLEICAASRNIFAEDYKSARKILKKCHTMKHIRKKNQLLLKSYTHHISISLKSLFCGANK